ncbi:hypothetical protein SISNIDRAFT_467473 [Sistotremastrum niveocremeum HHB9708]|uniref:Uncharacterized protein n=1 Tax=Sistotremastrum niveocremeum HHB9708 TaxID=1314777 RepID=A0A164SXL6_9AGAM|nr:hypothetical protein SISNIDRAFT_467473 [Sistotremastrum niveocremeum HHB9708]
MFVGIFVRRWRRKTGKRGWDRDRRKELKQNKRREAETKAQMKMKQAEKDVSSPRSPKTRDLIPNLESVESSALKKKRMTIRRRDRVGTADRFRRSCESKEKNGMVKQRAWTIVAIKLRRARRRRRSIDGRSMASENRDLGARSMRCLGHSSISITVRDWREEEEYSCDLRLSADDRRV